MEPMDAEQVMQQLVAAAHGALCWRHQTQATLRGDWEHFQPMKGIELPECGHEHCRGALDVFNRLWPDWSMGEYPKVKADG